MTRFSTIPRFLQRRPAPLSSRAATQWLTYSEPAPPRRPSIRPVPRRRHTNRVVGALDSPATFAKERSANPLSDCRAPVIQSHRRPAHELADGLPLRPRESSCSRKRGPGSTASLPSTKARTCSGACPRESGGSGPVRPVASRASSDDPGPRATGSLLVGVTPSLQAHLSLDKARDGRWGGQPVCSPLRIGSRRESERCSSGSNSAVFEGTNRKPSV